MQLAHILRYLRFHFLLLSSCIYTLQIGVILGVHRCKCIWWNESRTGIRIQNTLHTLRTKKSIQINTRLRIPLEAIGKSCSRNCVLAFTNIVHQRTYRLRVPYTLYKYKYMHTRSFLFRALYARIQVCIPAHVQSTRYSLFGMQYACCQNQVISNERENR